MKKTLGLLVFTILLMVGCPYILSRMVDGSNGLALLFILLFMTNPVYSIMVGIAAGKDLLNCLYYPFVVAISFAAGYMITFETTDMGLLVYAAGYLILGYVSMFITYRVEKSKLNTENE